MNYQSNGRPTYTGSEVIRALNPQGNRVPVIRIGRSFQDIQPNRNYDLAELFGRYGEPTAITVPDRDLGAQ